MRGAKRIDDKLWALICRCIYLGIHRRTIKEGESLVLIQKARTYVAEFAHLEKYP